MDQTTLDVHCRYEAMPRLPEEVRREAGHERTYTPAAAALQPALPARSG